MPEQARVLALLDELQAAEQAGVAALTRWIGCCQDPVLRGGLRVVRARDAGHAALALARLHELGGRASASVAPRLEALCELLGSSGSSDRVKLGILLARFPEGIPDPLEGVLGAIEGDDETRGLLDALRDDDRVSLDWLHAMGHAPRVVPRDRVAADERAAVVAFLGALRAALEGGADVTAAWAQASLLPGLRGGLRAAAARSSAHAILVAERLQELGGRPEAIVLPQRTLVAARVWYGAVEITDHQKLTMLLERLGSAPGPAGAIDGFVTTLAEDVETRELLHLLAAGEAATVAWLTAYRDAACAPERAESART